MKILRVARFFCCALLWPVSHALFGAPIPLEDFFRESEISAPSLSQDGTRIVFLMRNHPARTSIAVYDIKKQQGSIVFVPGDYNVDFAFWKRDRIVFGGDAGGNESFALRSIKADGSDLRDLSESVRKYRPVDGPVGSSLYSTLRDDPDHILIAGFGVRKDGMGRWQPITPFGLYRLNVISGKRTLVENWDDRATAYIVDPRSGEVYGRTRQSGGNQILEIKNLQGAYKVVGEYPGSTLPYGFAGLLPGNKEALVQVDDGTPDNDRKPLYVFDRDSTKLGRKLYAAPAGEIVQIHRDRARRVVGITYEAERRETDWFDPVWAKIAASLRVTFPDHRVEIAHSTDDAKLHIVYVYSDRDPGAFYIFDSVAPSLTPLGKINTRLDPARLANRQPVKYPARDGLEIHGYLTEPLGREGQKNPLILLPHGGPFGIRDSWAFDADAQFLASRGYSVLQVNYRGSGGYGSSFYRAGLRQWGRKMQDDLTDAVHWAIEKGITSPDTVAIYGASYGGYATLAGLVYTPELYRCGINYVGVSDLRLIVYANEDQGRGADLFFAEAIGRDRNELRDRSPVEHVANIRVPTLHAYGENDPRVDIGHWKVLERELKRHNKPYQYIRERDEGHGFESEGSRIAFYTAVEKFLAEHLPVESR